MTELESTLMVMRDAWLEGHGWSTDEHRDTALAPLVDVIMRREEFSLIDLTKQVRELISCDPRQLSTDELVARLEFDRRHARDHGQGGSERVKSVEDEIKRRGIALSA